MLARASAVAPPRIWARNASRSSPLARLLVSAPVLLCPHAPQHYPPPSTHTDAVAAPVHAYSWAGETTNSVNSTDSDAPAVSAASAAAVAFVAIAVVVVSGAFGARYRHTHARTDAHQPTCGLAARQYGSQVDCLGCLAIPPHRIWAVPLVCSTWCPRLRGQVPVRVVCRVRRKSKLWLSYESNIPVSLGSVTICKLNTPTKQMESARGPFVRFCA